MAKASIRRERKQQIASSLVCIGALLMVLVLVLCVCVQQAAAGGKGKGKGKGEDIIMYNGNIVMRGDKKGGTIVLANNHPHHEEVEFMPNFFSHFGEMAHAGGHHARRR